MVNVTLVYECFDISYTSFLPRSLRTFLLLSSFLISHVKKIPKKKQSKINKKKGERIETKLRLKFQEIFSRLKSHAHKGFKLSGIVLR